MVMGGERKGTFFKLHLSNSQKANSDSLFIQKLDSLKNEDARRYVPLYLFH